ncbi:MAG: DUF1641 domain-containing protein [Pseudonocardia sp.]
MASSLSYILDHADLLAVLVAGIHGFVERGDTITEAVVDGVRELRSAAPESSGLAAVDVPKVLASLADLSSGMVNATPALKSLLGSPALADTRTADTIGLLGEALAEGRDEAAKSPGGPTSVFGLLRVLKDDDVSRGIGLLVQVAKALGRRLA